MTLVDPHRSPPGGPVRWHTWKQTYRHSFAPTGGPYVLTNRTRPLIHIADHNADAPVRWHTWKQTYRHSFAPTGGPWTVPSAMMVEWGFTLLLTEDGYNSGIGLMSEYLELADNINPAATAFLTDITPQFDSFRGSPVSWRAVFIGQGGPPAGWLALR
jgi:hypothetical protein